jgi:diaminopimelate decarboxylase
LTTSQPERAILFVVGYYCETDTFANNRRIPEIKEGDILSFRNAGAYCYSMASNKLKIQTS